MSSKRKRFSVEYREQAARMVLETGRPIAHVARDLGIAEQTLGVWVANYRENHVDRGPSALDVDERAQLEELKRQARELRMENEFLKKCAAYFAQNQQ